MTDGAAPPPNSDVIVIGGGIIGFAIAFEASSAGLRVRLIDGNRAGTASLAAAGLIAPSLGTLDPIVQRVFDASAARFDEFTALVSRAAGRDVRATWGLLEIARDATESAELTARGGVLSTAELEILEPAVGDAPTGYLHARDGWIDQATLLAALREATIRSESVVVESADVVRVDRGPAPVVRLADGSVRFAPFVVVAAGAWTRQIEGLRPLPIEPVKGQLIRVRSPIPLRHAIAGGAGYLVPRPDGSVVVGSTMERVGFDPHPTTEGATSLLDILGTLSPRLARSAAQVDSWAGLRPMTPDRLPVVGADPECASVIYAAGHGKNGVLLAPITAGMVLDCLRNQPAGDDLTPFSPTRFTVGNP